VCTQQHFDIYKEIGVISDNKHWYEHVPKSAEKSYEDKVVILRDQQCEPTELSLTIDRAS